MEFEILIENKGYVQNNGSKFEVMLEIFDEYFQDTLKIETFCFHKHLKKLIFEH